MSTPASNEPKRLSCVSCRQRKIKCNRLDPCNHCVKAGQKCVFPKPVRIRGGSKMRNAEINKRISRLEGLLRKLNGEGGEQASAEDLRELEEENVELSVQQPDQQDNEEHDPVIRADGRSYLGGDLWATLSGEVDGLRQLLDEDSEEEEERQSASSRSRATDSSGDSVSPFFFNQMNPPMDLRQLHPYPPLITTTFCDIYFARIDPCFKLLHQPTMRSWLIAAAADLRKLSHNRPLEALMFAFYFATVCSLRPDECRKYFCDDKDSLVQRYKQGTEAALANADFLNSMELTTLQAFVIYVICTRTLSPNRSAWALASLAARLGQALNLHRDEDNVAQGPFESQMRRRTWWMIVMMDSCFCEDRGTPRSFLTPNTFPRMASNVNDADIWPGMTGEVHSRDGWTEMTYCLLCHEAAIAASITGRAQAPSATTTEGERRREQIVCDARDRIEQKYMRHCDERVPIQWISVRVSRCIIVRHWLGIHYPLHTKWVVHRSPSTKRNLLEAALSAIELGEELEHAEQCKPYIWFLMLWSQWYPLAVVLAELCSHTSGPHVERAWLVLDGGFVERWAGRLADGDDGGLWKPMRKLWDKARAVRAAALASGTASGAPPPATADQRQNSYPNLRAPWDVSTPGSSGSGGGGGGSGGGSGGGGGGGSGGPASASASSSSPGATVATNGTPSGAAQRAGSMGGGGGGSGTSNSAGSPTSVAAAAVPAKAHIDAALSGMTIDPRMSSMTWPAADGLFAQSLAMSPPGAAGAGAGVGTGAGTGAGPGPGPGASELVEGLSIGAGVDSSHDFDVPSDLAGDLMGPEFGSGVMDVDGLGQESWGEWEQFLNGTFDAPV